MWNYRIVKTTDDVTKEDSFEVCEVYYNHIGKPAGYCAATVGSETEEGLKEVLQMMSSALEKATIKSTEFK